MYTTGLTADQSPDNCYRRQQHCESHRNIATYKTIGCQCSLSYNNALRFHHSLRCSSPTKVESEPESIRVPFVLRLNRNAKVFLRRFGRSCAADNPELAPLAPCARSQLDKDRPPSRFPQGNTLRCDDIKLQSLFSL